MKLIVTVLCTLLIHYVLPQTGCPIKKPQLLSNTTSEGSGISLGEVSYEAYLYICLSMGAGQPSQWTPVCGGEHWTNREAKVACHQLGYPNTTTIAVTGGICSIPPAVTQAGVEVSRCSGTETTLEDCQLASTNCNNWGGVICTSLAYCPQEICHNTSYCHPSSTCSNCTTPPELNCICYTECDPPCSNGGSCSYNNTCQCTPNWTGQHCEQDLLTMTTMKPLIPSPCSKECQNGGNCSIGGYCTCTGNWTGSFCEEAVCSPGFCLHGGRCLYPNIRCTCLTGYGGSRCESNNRKNWASTTAINNTAGYNTTILYASIVATTLFGLLMVLIITPFILKYRQMRKSKVNTKLRLPSMTSVLKEEQDNAASSTARHNSGESITDDVLKEKSAEIPVNVTTAPQQVSESVTPSLEHETISLPKNNKECEILEPNNKSNTKERSKSPNSNVVYSVISFTATSQIMKHQQKQALEDGEQCNATETSMESQVEIKSQQNLATSPRNSKENDIIDESLNDKPEFRNPSENLMHVHVNSDANHRGHVHYIDVEVRQQDNQCRDRFQATPDTTEDTKMQVKNNHLAENNHSHLCVNTSLGNQMEILHSGLHHYDKSNPKENCYIQQTCNQGKSDKDARNSVSDEMKPELQIEHKFDQRLSLEVKTSENLTNLSPHRQDGSSILDTHCSDAGLEELLAFGAQHCDNLEPKGNCYVQQIYDQNKSDRNVVKLGSDDVEPELQADPEYDQPEPSIVSINRNNANMSPHTEDGYYYLDASSNGAGLEELGASDLHHYNKLDHRDGHCYSKETGDRKKSAKGDMTNRKVFITPEKPNEHSYDKLQHLSVCTQRTPFHANSHDYSLLEASASTIRSSLDYDYIDISTDTPPKTSSNLKESDLNPALKLAHVATPEHICDEHSQEGQDTSTTQDEKMYVNNNHHGEYSQLDTSLGNHMEILHSGLYDKLELQDNCNVGQTCDQGKSDKDAGNRISDEMKPELHVAHKHDHRDANSSENGTNLSPHGENVYSILDITSSGASLEELVTSGAQHYDNLEHKSDQSTSDRNVVNLGSDEVKPEQKADPEYDQLLTSIVSTNRNNANMSPHTDDGYYYLGASSNDACLEELGAPDLHHYNKLDHRDGHCYSKQKGIRKKTAKGDTNKKKIIIEHKNEHSYDQTQHSSVHTRGKPTHANSHDYSLLEASASTIRSSLDYDYIDIPTYPPPETSSSLKHSDFSLKLAHVQNYKLAVQSTANVSTEQAKTTVNEKRSICQSCDANCPEMLESLDLHQHSPTCYHTKIEVPSYIESVTLEHCYDEPGHEGHGQDTSIPQDEYIYASCDKEARALDIVTNQPLPTQFENTLNRCVPKTTEEHVYYDLTQEDQLSGHNLTNIEFDDAIYSGTVNQ